MRNPSIAAVLMLLLIACFGAEYSWSQDILVNDKTGDTAGIAGHFYNSVAMDSVGNFVTAWTDDRNAHTCGVGWPG